MYKPLVRARRTIRLLTLLPGSGEISCRLAECPLEDAKGIYKAVSYTWKGGTTTVQKCIYCGDFGKVEVTPNLYAVLRRLRHATDTVVVWIDRICIDQNNTEERTHQVGMMRDIYANSNGVIIWLGAGGDIDVGNQPIIEFWGDDRDRRHIDRHLERMGSDFDIRNDEYRRPDIYGAFCIISMLAQGVEASKIWYLRGLDYAPAVVQGLSSLLEMSWWTRIWVVQETVVATRAVVYCNNISMPWDVLSRAASQISRHSEKMFGPSAAKTYGPVLSCFHQQVREIDGTRDSWRAVEPLALLQLLRNFRNRNASDRRDKVFALLGLVKFWGGVAPLAPDYDQSLAAVFLETTKHLIRSQRSLAVLSGTKTSTKRLTQGFPTWLTDWSHGAPAREADRLSAQHMYKAAGDVVMGVRLHGSTLLEVKGFAVDRISSAFSSDAVPENGLRSPTSNGDTEKDLHGIIRWWEESVARSAQSRSDYGVYGTRDGVKGAFWRTICANLIYVPNAESENNKFRRTEPTDEDSFYRWRAGESSISGGRRVSIVAGIFIESLSDEETGTDQRIRAFHRSVECASRGRSFFLTEAGRMGLGPPTCQKGDEVYLLSGSRVPMILRASGIKKKCRGKAVERLVLSAEEANNSIVAGQQSSARTLKDHEKAKEIRCDEDHLNCFALVGDAYVHGMMDGNLVSGGDFSASPTATRPIYLV